MKGVCSRIQSDLQAMTQIAQQALPNGGGFQSNNSIWTHETSVMNSFLVRGKH